MDCAAHVAAPRRLELESKPLVRVDLKRATELRRAGHTIREIARMMQLSEATLMRRLRVAKVPRGPRIKKVPTMEALALYRSGVSVAELAKRFEVSPSWIRHELHKAGVRFTLGRPKGTFDGRPHEFAVDIDRIAARHREGKTIQEIADEMGLSRSVVHRRLRQRGQPGPEGSDRGTAAWRRISLSQLEGIGGELRPGSWPARRSTRMA